MAAKINSEKLSEILNLLLFKNKLNAVDLAKKVNLSQPNIHRLLTGKAKKPLASTLEPIAKFFSLSVEQLVGTEELPEYFLHESKTLEIPLYPWDELSKIDFRNPKITIETVFISNDQSRNCFATRMRGMHMRPLFPEGTLLIFDPDKKIYEGSYALVKITDDVCLFRQVFFGDKSIYLNVISPDAAKTGNNRFLEENDCILGILIEARQDYTNR